MISTFIADLKYDHRGHVRQDFKEVEKTVIAHLGNSPLGRVLIHAGYDTLPSTRAKNTKTSAFLSLLDARKPASPTALKATQTFETLANKYRRCGEWRVLHRDEETFSPRLRRQNTYSKVPKRWKPIG